MTKHYLEPMFNPTSVAVFGASSTPDSFGEVLFRNLLEGGYKGELYAINPKYDKIGEHLVYRDLREIGRHIDLAVVATPAKTVPGIIETCGEHGIKHAVIISGGFRETGMQGTKLEKSLINHAKRYGLRFLGPNGLGIMRPSIGLNTTLIKGKLKPGNLAFISQSGGLCTAVLDWATPNDLGFSTVLSLGISSDLDFGEVLDYLVSDPQTQGILMYIEGIHNARSFMSGLRAAARIKPVILIKSGRHETSYLAVRSHSSVLSGRDDVFDAALQRAGVVRVKTFAQLFSAAITLSSRYKAHGNRLGVVTNGGGPGVMASDRAADLGVPLAQLTQANLDALNECLPATWSHSNPVDIISDATPERFHKAILICLKSPNIDAVLVILTPQAASNPLETAKLLIQLAENSPKPILACWMGGAQTTDARHLFVQARIPQFRTPEAAVEAFHYLSAYHQNQQLLLQTPQSLGYFDEPDVEGARIIIEGVLAERRKTLTDIESKALLGAFRIPLVDTAIARSANEALVLAETVGFPIAMKVNSPDIVHKSEVGGVKLNIHTAQAVRESFKEITQKVQRERPDARVDGITVERMSDKTNSRELRVGVLRDPVFGPIITFGLGGLISSVLDDISVGLPPLNRYLAKTMIQKSRAAKVLGEFRRMPAVNQEAVENVLLRVSEMTCELPWLQELTINPLIVDEKGVMAVDSRITVDYHTPSPDRYSHMAIYPYPTHLVKQWQLPDGTEVIIRPIRPEDAEIEQEFVRNLSDESRYFRFMQTLHELTPTMLVRFTQIDYDREMALIAVTRHDGKNAELGVARYAINPDGESCEFALVIADEWQHRGFAHKLMNCLMEAARLHGLKIIQGEVLSNNHGMLKLMGQLGFSMILDEEDRGITLVSRQL